MTTLQLHQVGHRFALTEVLASIDLGLAASETVALVGPSGCGKTTLLNLVAGVLTCADGRIDNGFSSIAYVFQQPRLLPWKNARDNIALGLKARGVGQAERVRRAVALGVALGLAEEDLDKFPHALSGGMQSRVALARAMALEPDLLLLDEPFSTLDIGLKEELYGLLLEQVAARGSAVLMITHDLMEAVRLADRIQAMAPNPGRIVREFRLDRPKRERDDAWVYQTAAELMQAPEVREGFGLGRATGARNCVRLAQPVNKGSRCG